jgi:glycogen debranching enzyme
MADLDALVPHIEKAIQGARLWEFYVFDVQASVKEVAASLDGKSTKSWSGESVDGKSLEQIAEIVKASNFVKNYRAYASRYCTKADSAITAGLIQAAFPNDDSTTLASKWGKVLDIINVDLYRECEDDTTAAKDNVVGRLRFNRIDEGGPKMGEINAA